MRNQDSIHQVISCREQRTTKPDPADLQLILLDFSGIFFIIAEIMRKLDYP